MTSPSAAAPVPDKTEAARNLGAALRSQRRGDQAWRLVLIDGPNMSNLGEGGRDRRTYGTIHSIGELQGAASALAEGIGATMLTYQSNREGDIVQFIYDSAERTDAYLINPAALTRRLWLCNARPRSRAASILSEMGAVAIGLVISRS